MGGVTLVRERRLAALRRIHDLLVERSSEVVEILTSISVHRAAVYELGAALRTLRGAAGEMALHRPGRVPQSAVFMPSNVVLYSYVLYLLVPSLFTERIRFRPSTHVLEQTMALHELLVPVHRLPIEPAVVSQRAFLRDTVAAADVVVFTGAYQNAETIRAQLALDQLMVYFGAGVNPFVVVPDADLELAARDAADIRLLNSGQDCLAPDVFLVHEEILDGFVDRLIRELKGRRYGAYDDPAADYGAVFYPDALRAAALHLCRRRADIVHGGAVDFSAGRLEPAVLLGPASQKMDIEEYFTPIFNVASFNDVEALGRMLDTGRFAERALGASVYGTAVGLVESLRRRHTVTVDRPLTSLDDGNTPFGGYGPMANYTAVHGRLTVGPTLVSKAVADHLGAF